MTTETTATPALPAAADDDGSGMAVIGFDLGHGDTALTKVHVGTRTGGAALGDRNAPPEVIELGGDRRQLVTAVAVTPQDAVLIGEDAVAHEGSRKYVAFKSPDLDEADVRIPLELFARRVVEDVRATHLGGAPRVRWVFGHPSGWTPDQVAGYRELLAEVCAPDEVSLVPESRAALLYARDAGDIPDSDSLTGTDLAASTLIVDIGSSTTDYTSVVDGKGRLVDHGNVVLGAHLIDKSLLALAVDRSPDARRLRAELRENPDAAQTLEIAARKLKEKFFALSPERLRSNPRMRVRTTEEVFTEDDDILALTLTIDQDDMARILAQPLTALEGRSWQDACRQDLAAALDHVGKNVESILLTGGPSRMRFVREIARELAPDAHVILGTEPEFAIARGLALAGRMDQRGRGFRADVEQFLATDTVRTLVEERLPELTAALAATVASGLTESHVIPATLAWQRREIVTIDDLRERIADGVRAELDSTHNDALKEIISDWMARLRPELAQHTAVICRRWNLEPSALALPDVVMSGGRLTVDVDTSATTDVLNNLGNLANFVISGIVATVLFGSGMALVMATGPIAVLAAGAAVFVGIDKVKGLVIDQIGDKDIPAAMRRLGGKDAMVRKLRAQAPQQEKRLAQELSDGFQSAEDGRLAREITASIGKQLAEVADRVELLIR
ncbi:Hsp70 family protein [Streptomyces sp. NPDC096132]|uniref:Hsp70 family protein n=1 Tax=Streptomyces sp. NPDC096132 TaxID=3366075 RepID=UPI0037FC7F0C